MQESVVIARHCALVAQAKDRERIEQEYGEKKEGKVTE
jgi:hypothetical protein